MDADKQIRAEVVGYRCPFFKFKEIVRCSGHFDSQPSLFEQPSYLAGDRQIDALFVKTENTSRTGIFAAMSGIDYNGPG